MNEMFRKESDNGFLDWDQSDVATTWTFVPKILPGVHYYSEPQNVTICKLDHSSEMLTVWPIVPYPDNVEYMQSKFSQVKAISFQFEDVFSDWDELVDLSIVTDWLPGAFTKQWQYGLGLAKQYRPIVHIIEQNSNCTEIVVGPGGEPSVESSIFSMSVGTFENLCSKIRQVDNLANSAAMRIKRASVRNTLASSLGVMPKTPGRGKLALSNALTDSITGDVILTEAEQDELVAATSKYSDQIARTKPESLVTIRKNIDVAILDQLISDFSDGISAKRNESFWQLFFKKNPYALHLAFGYPLVQVQDQAYVGGTRLAGGGARFSDFVSKNAITNSVAIFEIKKPASKLVNRVRYRNNVLPPSTELTGAVLQVLDQRNKLSQTFANLKLDSKVTDIEMHSIRCCVIIGVVPEAEDARATLESFRANSSMVEIVTFDELLAKLRQLRLLLVST